VVCRGNTKLTKKGIKKPGREFKFEGSPIMEGKNEDSGQKKKEWFGRKGKKVLRKKTFLL